MSRAFSISFLMLTSCAAAAPPKLPEPARQLERCDAEDIVEYIDLTESLLKGNDRTMVREVKAALAAQDAKSIAKLIGGGLHGMEDLEERQFWFVALSLGWDYLDSPDCDVAQNASYSAAAADALPRRSAVNIDCELDINVVEAARLYLLWRMDAKGGYACR